MRSVALITDRIHETREWLSSELFNDVDAECLKRWQGELNSLEDTIKTTPKIRIAMVGSTGAGKSTLLNALLGTQILPVSSMKPCTAVITTVESTKSDHYTADISFLSREEWETEMAVCQGASRV